MIQLKRIGLVAIVLVWSLAFSAVAASDLKWSAEVGGIYSFSRDIDYTDVDGASGEDRVEDGFGLNLLIARRLSRFSIELEALYLQNEAKEYQAFDDPVPTSTTGEFSQTALMVNGLYHMVHAESWGAYIGAGVGASRVAVDGLSDTEMSFLIDGDDIGGAVQAKIGGIYWASSRVGVQFGYRLFWNDEVDLPAVSLPDGEKWTNVSGPAVAHNLEIGVRIRW